MTSREARVYGLPTVPRFKATGTLLSHFSHDLETALRFGR
jgi:hypothetical protein